MAIELSRKDAIGSNKALLGSLALNYLSSSER